MTAGMTDALIGRWRWSSLMIGVVASAACIVGAWFDLEQFMRAYLYTYLFLLGLSLGGLALVMIHHLTGGAWGFVIRRTAEAQMKMLPLMALLFLPIAVGLRHVYPWGAVRVENAGTAASFWAHYLEPRFFYLRAAAYFAAWLILAVLMNAWSRRQDDLPDARTYWRAYKASGFGLVVLGVSLHFAAMDWIMSLQSGFTSTIFGPLIFSSQLVSSYALCVFFFCWLIDRPEFENIVSGKLMNDLGSLLFTLLTLWAYMAWFQYMLIWIADVPHGNVWYLVRWRGAWGRAESIVIVFQFVIPFVLLLFRIVKQSRRGLAWVSAIIFVGQLVFMYYNVVPIFVAPRWTDHWMDLVMPLGLGGIWFAGYLWTLSRRQLLPANDLNYSQAILLRELDLEEMARAETVAHE
jgi:hypothetical protein